MSFLKEFAIEPAAIASWVNFQLLFPDFGVGRGRLIARYPKDWTKQVESLVSRLAAESKIPPLRATAIIARIYAEKHKFIPARRHYANKGWLENAEATSPTFDMIVALSNPRNTPEVMAIDDLDKADPRYGSCIQKKIPRSGAALAECARLLLNVCSEIIIVEPNFDATERRFTETIHEILEMRTAAPQQLSRFEIHTKRSQTFRADIQRAHFERAFASVLPEQTKLKGFFWEPKQGGEKLHPRFLLTELGGIQFDYGLDEGDGAKDTTIVSALDHALYEQLRQDYSATGTAFEIRPDSILEISSTNKRRRSL